MEKEESGHHGPSEALGHVASRSLNPLHAPHPGLLTSSDEEPPLTQAAPSIIGSLHRQCWMCRQCGLFLAILE